MTVKEEFYSWLNETCEFKWDVITEEDGYIRVLFYVDDEEEEKSDNPTPDVKLFWANGSYCTTSGNMCDFNFAVRDVSLEGASRRAEQLIKGDGRRRYSGKLDMEVCAAGNY